MPLYESVFIARQDIPAQEVESLADGYAGLISENGGEVKRREYWGLRNLAYRIKKSRKGHYIMMHIEAPSGAISEMERNMRISEDVLRYMTLRVEELEEGPSAMLQNRSSRDDRGRRDDGRGRSRHGPRQDARSDEGRGRPRDTDGTRPAAEKEPAAAEGGA